MAKSQSMTLTTDDDEEITVVCTPYESVEAYELMARMSKVETEGAMKQMQFMRKELLTQTYVVRNDSKGEPLKIELGGPNADKNMNRAFKGTGVMGIARAAQFSYQVNFADFFAAADRERQAKLDATKLSTDEATSSD